MKPTTGNPFSTYSDEELMCRMQQGELSAFRALMQRYKAVVMRFAYHYSGDSATARDIARDTFVQLYNTAGQYTPPREFSTWIFGIAVQVSMAVEVAACEPAAGHEAGNSSTGGSTCALEHLLFPDTAHRNSIIGGHVQHALCRIAEVPRAILVLRDILLLSTDKVASIADCDKKTVETLCEQGRVQFRKELQQLHGKHCMPN